MKTLLLIRHAKSDWADSSLPDFDRPLNSRGVHDAPMMAEMVASKGITPDLIISSPAERAYRTAVLFSEEYNYPHDLIEQQRTLYTSSIRDILDMITKIEDKRNTVFIFGHNPEITYTAAYLSNNKISEMSTCAVACIDFDVKSWTKINPKKAKLRFYEYPKHLK